MNANSVAIIRARLPYVDRRALSEAWFSALHLAGDQRASSSRRRAPLQRAVTGSPLGHTAATRSKVVPLQTSRAPKTALAGGVSPERAVARRESVRRDTLVPIRSIRYAPVRASFGLGIDGGRVQILVRRQGAVLHVIALCSERHVELVRRALVCADAHLRGRGERVESSVRAFDGSDVVR